MDQPLPPNSNNQKNQEIKLDREQGRKVAPLAPIRDVVVFPHTEAILAFGRPKSMAAVEAGHQSGQTICLFTQKNPETKDPKVEDLYEVGVLVELERVLQIEGMIHAIVKGIKRVRRTNLVAETPYLVTEYEEVAELTDQNDELSALVKHTTSQFKKAVNLGKSADLNIFMRIMSGVGPGELADQVASTLDIEVSAKQKILEIESVNQRLNEVVKHLAHEIRVLELESSIYSKTQKRMDKSMREAILRERKKTIENELRRLGYQDSDADMRDPEVSELQKKIKEAGMPKDVQKKAEKELKRLAQMSMHNPERSYLQNYLDWLVEMPWSKSSSQDLELSEAIKILEEEHYGLKKVKERIIEYLAVMKLKQQAKQSKTSKGNGQPANSEDEDQLKTNPEDDKQGKIKSKKPEDKSEAKKDQTNGATILCLVGPPGVGKTSIGKSIARALGRKFVRMSLGGIRDEAEIRGHRRTYIGALPGRIIQGVKNAGTNNPVFMLDEIDKLGTDFRGDPSSALLEALDPEQNREFSDHYLEVPFDLSQVMFLTTANLLDPIPPALKDRLEVIEFTGYTEEEKVQIGSKYLWPKQLKIHVLPEDYKITEDALRKVVRHYTRESGVRNLERNLATICRKIARQLAEKSDTKSKVVEENQITDFLGPIKFRSQLADKKNDVGVATGLAYTPVGGSILFIEVALMPGKGKLTLTGHLGQVMKESCKAAHTYVRTRWRQLGISQDLVQKTDVHIHVPEGAVPKDGPSAGAAIATALTSAFTRIPSRKDVAMTGEVTLRGRVTEIGGVKQKVIAAHLAGIKTVIMPKDNEKDLKEIPESVKKDIKFVFVDHMDQVLPVALTKQPNPKEAASRQSKRTANGHEERIRSEVVMV